MTILVKLLALALVSTAVISTATNATSVLNHEKSNIYLNAGKIAAITHYFPLVKVVSLDQNTLNYSKKYIQNNAKVLANLINTVIVVTQPHGMQSKGSTIDPLPGYRLIQKLYLDEHGYRSLYGAIFLSANDKNLIIVYRGTQSEYEWGLDKSIWPQVMNENSKWMAANGFYQAFIQNQHIIEKMVKQYSSVRNVWVTGHSIGAAVATITGLDLIQLTKSQGQTLSLYTFGCPRVLNGIAAKHMDASSNLINYRVVNIADPIPDVPPAATIQPYYRHAGKPIYYHYNGPDAGKNHGFYLTKFLTGTFPIIAQ